MATHAFFVSQDLSLEEAELLTLRVLRQVMEEKLSADNVQLATVTPAKGPDGQPSGQFRILSQDALQNLVSRID